MTAHRSVRAAPGALAVLAVVALAGCGSGGGDAPPRRVATVALARPPLADALAKQAAQARLAGGELGPVLERLKTQPALSLKSISRSGVTLRDVAVRRRGDRVAAEATVPQDELDEYAPAGVKLRYVAGGPGATFTGTKKVLGVDVDVTLHIVAEDGAVVAEPDGLPIGRTVVFSDPRVHVDGVAAHPVAGGLRVRGVGTLRSG